MKKFEYQINDECGIHARPAGLLVQEANKYKSSITITRGMDVQNAKKVFGIMLLAVKKGDTVTIAAEGEDEEKAIAGLEQFMKAHL